LKDACAYSTDRAPGGLAVRTSLSADFNSHEVKQRCPASFAQSACLRRSCS
jgi:hypothetical protein